MVDNPSGQAAVQRVTQLLGCVFMQLVLINDRGIHGVGGIIEHHDTAPLAPNILQRRKKEALQHRPQVQSGGNLPADAN